MNELLKTTKYYKIFDRPLMKYLKDNEEEICNYLMTIGIKKIVLFDEIEKVDWNGKMTLVLLPELESTVEENEELKSKLESLGVDTTDIIMSKEYIDDYDKEDKEIITYFKNLNLVVANTNPFTNEQTYNLFKSNLKKVELKHLTKKNYEFKIFKKSFLKGLNNGINKKEREINSIINNITTYRQQYIDSNNDLIVNKKYLEYLKSNLDNTEELITKTISKIKSMPIIENFEINSKGAMEVMFKPTYINDKVRVRVDNKEGMEIPVYETKKVYIGQLKFIISDRVLVRNLDNVIDDIPHPHATNENICFGTADLQMNDLIAKMDYVGLIKLLYSWSMSYNKDSTYISLQRFYDKQVKED